jgi:hypothetical protein
MMIRGPYGSKENDTMKQLLLPVALATLALASACSSSKDDAKKGGASQAAGETAAAEDVVQEEGDSFKSNIAAVAFNPVTELPKAPASASSQSECDWLLKAPQSPAARMVAKAGWGVTGEGRIGKYRAVSFAGAFAPATSGSCEIGKGNVAIFDGETIVAIAYAPSSGKQSIAKILPFEEDSLRIWDGDIVPAPVADIRVVDGKGLVIQKLAGKEMACGGGTPIPNIYGMPITRARKALAKAGWDAVGNGDAEGREDSREADLAAKGVTEVASCSGTGFGFCAFDYKRPEAALAVTTVGDNEDPSVADYAVRCGG